MNRMGQISLSSAQAPEDGVASLDFAVYVQPKHVALSAHMNPDEKVIDGDDGDFPQFDCVISWDDFKRFRDMINSISVEP